MAGKEYHEGRGLEKNTVLQESIKALLKFDEIHADGANTTKGDMVGITDGKTTPVSVKYASGKNTQVHLPTLRSLATALEMPEDIRHKLDMFLGTNDVTEFQSWLTTINMIPNKDELKYNRINAFNIPDWGSVETWFNDNRRKIATLLLQSLKNENPALFLVWAEKKKNTFSVLDVNSLVDYIADYCTWVTMPRGTVLRCAVPSLKEGKIGNAIFFMQMKNSGGPEGGYNHNPQFHLVKNWNQEHILHEITNIQFE